VLLAPGLLLARHRVSILRAVSEPLDHELKMDRAFEHVSRLDAEVKGWLNGNHHSVRPEGDPKTGTRWLATAEKPPRYPIGVLIGDFLHNLRSSLDLLAYSLASAYTSPLPGDLAETSEFPIFGDEDRSGTLGVGHGHFHKVRKNGHPAPGSGLSKIRGWHPNAQAIIEGLQPYKRGNAYRSDPLWVLHDLARINRHRLLHTTVASFSGIGIDLGRSINVGTVFPGTIRSLGGTVETDTPIAEFPPIGPVNPSQPMHVEIQPRLDVAFAQETPGVEEESVVETLYGLYTYVRGDVISALTPYL
jgi:hypothetical protein